MILGYHVIITAYGFWLPNDPRGSWSEFVRKWELRRFGPATKITARHSLARNPHDYALRQAAKKALSYPPVHFSGIQARGVGVGFVDFVKRSGIVVWACSILPEHVHLVIARHTYKVEQITNLMKGAATTQLLQEGIHPFQDVKTPRGGTPRMWTQDLWKVFLDSDRDIRRAIGYVEENPMKEGKSPQRWSFVTRYRPA